MTFVPGKVVKKFEVDGKKIGFRYPKKEDLDQLHKYINTVIKERAFIGRQKPISRKEETKWLSDTLKGLKKKDEIRLIVDIEGKVLGSGEVKRKELDANRHVGSFGITLLKECRNMGIGTRLADTLFRLAKKDMGIRIIQSSYYSMNKASEKLHNKLGFREIGKIPKGCNHYGKYYDEIIMIKEV